MSKEYARPEGGPVRLDVGTGAPTPARIRGSAPPATEPPVAGVSPREESSPTISAEDASHWERWDLPSNFIPYDWNDVSLRVLFPRDHAKIARAVRGRSVSVLFDVLAATSTRDPRDLTFNDMQAVLTWHKRNSYINSSYTVQWTSRYGVRGSQSVKGFEVRERRSTKTRSDYLAAKRAGLALPTCADIEIFSTITDEDTIYLFDHAQWLDVDPLRSRVEQLRAAGDRAPTVTARIEELERRGMSAFAEVNDFLTEFTDYGVSEHAHVRVDAKRVDLERAVATLRDSSNERGEHAEAEGIEALMASGRQDEFKPLEEEVPVAFDLWSMFPYV